MSTTPGAPDAPAPLHVVRTVIDPRGGERVVVSFLCCPRCGRALSAASDGWARCETCREVVEVARACAAGG